MISILGVLLKKVSTTIYFENVSLVQKYDNVNWGVSNLVDFTKGFIQHTENVLKCGYLA